LDQSDLSNIDYLSGKSPFFLFLKKTEIKILLEEMCYSLWLEAEEVLVDYHSKALFFLGDKNKT